MKFVISLAVLALLSADRVCGFKWLKKRDSERIPARECLTPSCRNVFEPVMDILGTPALELLIQDGRLSLDCSRQNLDRADKCTNPSSFLCASPYQIQLKLNTALNIFCRNEADIEKEASCWTSGNVIGAIISCYDGDREVYGACAQQSVGNLQGCSTTTGAIVRQLVLALVD
ncbi:uncharacterized protein [Haliotis asinina]|uniref:uncharacterized protein n=1 Tax=Haliotis asinina TaxID=109174 RepID=UPI003531ED32